MLRKKIFLFFLLFPLASHALLIKPWFSEVLEFELDTSYTYSRYRHVQDSVQPLKHASNDHLVAFDLSLVPVLGLAAEANWCYDIEVELADTPRQSFGFRSAAAQVRYLWLDDVVGDFASITTGLNIRGVSHTSLRDVSCPYHYYGNIELNAAIGKEWDRMQFWVARTFAFLGIGTAYRGYPWIRAHFAVEGDHQDRYQYQVFGRGYFGLGHQNKVNIDHFHGYEFIRHQSIDIGASFRYLFELWGSLSLEYAYRVYAHSFPEHVNFVTICYRLPFSLF
jgi:hypothetical protein